MHQPVQMLKQMDTDTMHVDLLSQHVFNSTVFVHKDIKKDCQTLSVFNLCINITSGKVAEKFSREENHAYFYPPLSSFHLSLLYVFRVLPDC